jgi:hypothetical protein
VVIDPAAAYVGRAGKDSKSNAELRSLLDPCAELAARRGVTFALITHCSKAHTTKAVHKVLDSVGWVNTVRAAYLVAPDPQDQNRKLLLHLKGNLGNTPTSLAYRLVTPEPPARNAILAPLEHLNASEREELARQMVKVEWLGPVTLTADEVIAHRPDTEADEVAEWLVQFLTPYAFPSLEVYEAAAQAGLSEKQVRTAKQRLKGQVQTKRMGFLSSWWLGLGPPDNWTLRPESGAVGCNPGGNGTGQSEERNQKSRPTCWADILGEGYEKASDKATAH